MRRPCTTPGCRGKTDVGTNRKRCDQCRAKNQRRNDQMRGSAAERGYGHDWVRNVRAPYLAAHNLCILCGAPSQVPDHHPESRKELIARGVANPNAWCYLRPLCEPCHRSETARNQPGGFGK